MGLKIEDKFYVHNLLFVDDQDAIIRGVGDASYTGRELKKKREMET
jgi:hypothetical protein